MSHSQFGLVIHSQYLWSGKDLSNYATEIKKKKETQPAATIDWFECFPPEEENTLPHFAGIFKFFHAGDLDENEKIFFTTCLRG